MHPLLLLGTLLLCPPMLVAQVTYQTSYISPDDGRSAKATLQIVKDLPLSSNARLEFFSESLTNTSLTESELVEKMRSGNVRTQLCGYDCNLITARLASGTSQYWRRVQAHEPVTYVFVEDEWKPWFLPRCANPVQPAPKSASSEAIYVDCTCAQTMGTPTTHYHYSTVTSGGLLWFGHESVPSDPVFFYPNQTVCCTGGTQ